jgi:maltooligosyltrehalose trehalohydrolase
MNKINIEEKSAGVAFNSEGMATISVWAPLAEKVELYLPEDNATIPLTRKEYGYWKTKTKKLHPGNLYKFILNGEKERPDPCSISQPEGVHGPSKALDIKDFKWTDANWKNLPLQDYILYELHTGTFTPEGTFNGVEQKLDYLKDLGINAIEIMPVAQFPGKRNWGYDGVYPFAVQYSYGAAKGLQQLVDKCHERGLAVILDVVYNHLGPEGNYLNDFGPYFTDKYNTPWGKAINFDDAWCDGVRQYFIENVLMWFRDFHIDGLRLDAVHAIKDFSPRHILREIKEHVNLLMNKTGRTYYLIVESDLNDTRFINPLKEDGYGMDAQWIDEFHHALRVAAGGERTGYYADFEGISHLAKAYKNAYVYDGIYSPHRFKTFGTRAENNPGQQFIVFSQNHDQVGNRMLGERTSQLHSFEMQKLLAGAVLISPYLPMLFMGEEWSASEPFLYFVSHTDPDLMEAVRKGRKAEFAAFHAKGEAPDPQAEDTFLSSKLGWNDIEKDDHRIMLLFYKNLIILRKQHNALRFLNRNNVNVQHNEQQQTITLYRWYEKEHVLCFMNFSDKQQEENMPFRSKSQWTKILDSADKSWKGPAAAPDSVAGNSALTLQPQSITIYTNNRDV